MKTMKIVSYIVAVVLATTASAQSPATTMGSPNFPIDEQAFTRYASGWECARASAWTENRFWRDKRPDTTYYARPGNPTQRSTVETVRKCIERFNLPNTKQRDIIGLMQAFLTAEQESQADAAATKLAAAVATQPAAVKAWALYQITDIYLGAAQPKLPKAEKYLTQLDAIGVAAAVERMLAHKGLADVARFRDSVPLWDRELKAALSASKQITGDTRKEYAFESAKVYLGIADYNGRINNPQAAIQAIETARAELVPLRQAVGIFLRGQERPYVAMGQAVSPVQATKWFNTNGNNVHPISGKPALLVFVSKNCGSRCYPSYSVLRRLKTKFEAKGLDIVFMTRTSGYHRNRLVKPDSETIFIDDYFTNYLKLPINLAVWQAEFGKRNDGKLTVLSAPNDEALNFGGSAYIVDSKGTIRLVTGLSRENEAILEDVIASLF